VLDELVEAGFSLFATATNHCLDYSISGLLHTIEAMEVRGLSFAGVGRNLEDARRPCYHTHPHGTVAMISCASSFAKGQEASAQRPDMPGRPGLNPLRFETVHEVTEAQLAALREIAGELGLEAERQAKIKMGFGFAPSDPAVFPLNGTNFRALPAGSNRPVVRTSVNRKDVEGMLRWVREARGLADVVAVSLHAHEQMPESKELPAEFIPAFAREMIDGGADLVVGHGPHLLRGMEIYKGKPIFYSLGNFIFQPELLRRLPADDYDTLGWDVNKPAATMQRLLFSESMAGFGRDRRYWETVLPICTFEDRQLTEITLHPITLGFGEPAVDRGTPRLATGDLGREILESFKGLSEPFGVIIDVSENIGTFRL
jgi:poly-gamma-glutamate synthesis protein (capsule biosynthesis protein)